MNQTNQNQIRIRVEMGSDLIVDCPVPEEHLIEALAKKMKIPVPAMIVELLKVGLSSIEKHQPPALEPKQIEDGWSGQRTTIDANLYD